MAYYREIIAFNNVQMDGDGDSGVIKTFEDELHNAADCFLCLRFDNLSGTNEPSFDIEVYSLAGVNEHLVQELKHVNESALHHIILNSATRDLLVKWKGYGTSPTADLFGRIIRMGAGV